MNSKRSSIAYIAAVFITVALLFMHQYLPKRHFQLLPGKDSWAFSTDDREVGGNSEARWQDDGFSQWVCTLRHGPSQPNCSIGVALSRDQNDWTVGTDLSAYDSLILNLTYTGNAKMLRIHLRNFDPLISSPDDYNSPKFNKVNLRISDLDQPIRLSLSEFQLADWWIDQYDIPRKWSQAAFDRVTAFGIDFASVAPIGKHEIHINRIAFVGSYVSSSQWYLSIISGWMGVVLFVGVRRLRELHIRGLQDAEKFRKMTSLAHRMKAHASDFQTKSITDTLTGTLNRQGLQNIIDTAFEWRRKDDKLVLILLDIDHFKRINDLWGHDVGDKVLISIGKLLLDNTRNIDTVARWGGEEFLILCPQSNEEDGFIIAEKIRLKLRLVTWSECPKLRVSTSVGVTAIKHSEDFVSAFKRADLALYTAKQTGRNHTVINSPEEKAPAHQNSDL